MKKDDEKNFLSGLKTQDKMSILLKSAGMTAFEYLLKEDQMIYYNAHLKVDREMPGFLKKLEASSGIPSGGCMESTGISAGTPAGAGGSAPARGGIL